MRPWLILAALTFARSVMGFQFQSVPAVGLALLDELQLDYATLGTLTGLYLLPGVIVALSGGYLGQRFGDKVMVCIGLLAMTLGGALMSVSGSVMALGLGRLVSGCGAVVLNVLATKMATDWFEGRRLGTAMGVLVTSWPLGIALAMVLLPGLASASSWAAAMLLPAALSLLALVVIGLVYQSPLRRSGTPGPRRSGSLLSRHEIALATLSGLVWTFYNLGFILVLTFGAGFLIAAGQHPARASAVISTVSWLILPAIPVGAWIAERFGRPEPTMLACFTLLALAIWSMAVIGGSLPLLAALGMMFGPPAGLIMTLPAAVASGPRRSLVMGIYFSCYYIGMGVVPGLAGVLRDQTLSAAAPIWLAGGMLVLAACALVGFRLVQGRASPHRSDHTAVM